jgi:hypothetical protein
LTRGRFNYPAARRPWSQKHKPCADRGASIGTAILARGEVGSGRARQDRSGKLKALLRKAVVRTVDPLWCGLLVDLFTPQECGNYFASAGRDAI